MAGLARAWLQALAGDQADVGHLHLRCHIRRDSAARQFWEHAGFVVQSHDGVYVAMERAPQGPPP